MNINNSFSGQYVKSSEIEHDTVLTIRKVSVEAVGMGDDQEEKPIVYFSEIDRGLVLNKTNAGTITGLYGAETDDWIGKQITLYATEVSYQGKQMLGLRIRMTKPAPPQDGRAQAQADIGKYAGELKTMTKKARNAGDVQQADEWDATLKAARMVYGNPSATVAELAGMAAALQSITHPIPQPVELPF